MTEHIPPIRASTDVISGNSKAIRDVMKTKLRVIETFLKRLNYNSYCIRENLVDLLILYIRIPLKGI